MYLHLGGGTVIKTASIVGIFDLDNTTASKWTRKLLSEAERDGRVFESGDGIPRSFVLVSDRFGQYIYLSQLSSATLTQRAEENLAL